MAGSSYFIKHKNKKKLSKWTVILWSVVIILVFCFLMIELVLHISELRGISIGARLHISAINQYAVEDIAELPNMSQWESYCYQAQMLPANKLVEKKIHIGWNLGNTLDSLGNKADYTDETYWHNPYTSAEILEEVSKAGFQIVRVPVTFANHMDEDGKIDEAWLRRISEVVDYVLQNDMYCVINTHWDGSWIILDGEGVEESRRKFVYVWQQIAEYFAMYDEHLLFEGFNEIRDRANHYNSVEEEALQSINTLNQIFVDTIRAGEGYNKVRYLVVTPYTAHVLPKILKAFELPKDTVENRLIVDIHTYCEIDELESAFDNLDEYLLQRNIPVLIGEFGQRASEYSDEERLAYVKEFRKHADELKIAYLWWDTGGYAQRREAESAFSLLDRRNLNWLFPEIVEELVN